MRIYPGGKSTRIDSPRHLTLRHCRRVISTNQLEFRRDIAESTVFLPNGERRRGN